MRSNMRIAVVASICAGLSFGLHAQVQDPQSGENVLRQDLGVTNGLRYCAYTYGRVHTYDESKPCPRVVTYYDRESGRDVGFLRSESNEGAYKVCRYNLNGVEKLVRQEIPSTCMGTKEF